MTGTLNKSNDKTPIDDRFDLTIDPEFHRLIPPMDADERKQLEANIARDGCRDPLVTWNGVIVDGHTRYDICRRGNISFRTVAKEFKDRNEAKVWIITNQFGRRNLKPFQRAELAMVLEPLIAGRAKEKQRQHGGTAPGKTLSQKSDEVNTKKEVAKLAGVSHDTIHKSKVIAANAVEPVKQKLRKGEMSINTGAALAELPRAEQTKVVALPEKEILAAARQIKQKKSQERQQKRLAEMSRKAVEQSTAVAATRFDWRIEHGDSIKRLQKITERPRLIFADPPYNIGVDYGDGKSADLMPETKYVSWCKSWMSRCAEMLTPDGSLWVMICDEYAGEFAVTLKSVGLMIQNWIKWYETFGVNCADKFNRTSRHIFYCLKNPNQRVFNTHAIQRPSARQVLYNDGRAAEGGKLWDDVWTIPRLVGTSSERIPSFPTQLPVALLKTIVQVASEPGDWVIDPFNGSGTTGAASLELGRRYIGIERSEEFAALARQRLTGIGGPETKGT